MHVLDAHTTVARAGIGAPFTLRFSFDVAVRPADSIYLVVESPERFAVTIKGQPVTPPRGGEEFLADAGWWGAIFSLSGYLKAK